jgi:serine/threonine-protein kinase
VERIGKYEIQAEIGRGGFGRVYRGFDPTVGRVVAIKVLLPDASDPEFLTRFKLEATTAGNLHHPNLVTVHEFGEEAGNHYLVMEYLEGDDLQKILRDRRPITILDKVEIMQQVAAGLHCAHESGIVHRDVKPANIMVMRDNLVKMMDFGIARLTRADTTRFTKAGFLVGTLNYMSPEQFRDADVDALCDIWAFGVIYYEFVTGRFPFEGSTPPAILYSITNIEPPAPSTLVPDCPESLSQLIMKTLSKDRDLRYQSLHEFQLDAGPILMELRKQRASALLPEARSLFEQQRGEEAQRVVRRILDLDSMNAEARQLRERIQKMAQQQAILPKVGALKSTGQELLAKGRFAEAIQNFENALRMDSANTEIRQLLDQARGSVDKFRKAQDIAEAAAKLADTQEFTAAHEMVKQALAVDPTNTRAREVLTRVQHAFDSQERRKEVTEVAARAASIASTGAFDEALALLNDAAKRLHEPPEIVEAAARIEDARKQKLESDRRQRALAEAAEMLHQERVDQAENILHPVRKEAPNEPGLAELLSACAELRGKLERRDAVRRVTERVNAMQQDGELDRALALAERALAEFAGEAALVSLRDDAAKLVKQRDERRAIDETLRAATDLRAAGKAPEALAKLRDTLERVGGVPALQSLANEIANDLRASEQRAAIQSALAEARALIGQSKFAGALAKLRGFAGDPEAAALIASVEKAAGEAAASKEREAGLAAAREQRAKGALDQAIETINAVRAKHGDSPMLRDLEREIEAERQLAQKRQAVTGTAAEAKKRIAASQWDSARVLLQKTLKDYPGEPELTALLDGIERGLSEQQARKEKDEAIKKARVLEGQGRDADALAAIDAALQAYPGDPELFSARAALAMRSAERQRAGDLSGRMSRIQAAIDRGQFDTARQDLDDARSQFGEQSALLRLADEIDVKRRMAEHEAGAKAIEQLIEKGALAEAGPRLHQALSANPRNARLLKLQQLLAAETAFAETLQTIEQHLDNKRLDLAENLLRNASGARPPSEAFKRLLQRLAKEREKLANERNAALKKAADLSRRGSLEEAAAILRSLIDQNPKDAEAIQALDKLNAERGAHLKQRDYANRIADLENKRRNDQPQLVKEGAGVLLLEFPNDPQAMGLLAWADKRLHELGAPKQGIATWKVAVAGVAAIVIAAGAYFALRPKPGTISWNVSTQKMAFTWKMGESLPEPKQIALSSANGVVSLTAGGAAQWLNVDPAHTQTPGQFSIAIAPAGLAPGDYKTQIKIDAATGEPKSRTIDVTMKITGRAAQPQTPNAPSVSVDSDLLTFDVRQGATSGDSKVVQVRGSGVSRISVAARTRGSWLSATPTSASLPASISVQVSPAGLAPGSYQGEVAINADGAAPQRINVSLRVREADKPVVITQIPDPPKKQPDPPKEQPKEQPKEAPIPVGTYAGPKRGNITWVGELAPGQKVTISKDGGSSGSANRTFPGDVPIRIEVTTPGVTVESAPAAANRFSRAVLVNNSAAPVTLIQIRWFVQE